MRRRSRLLRVAKWGGVVLCTLIASGYIVFDSQGFDWDTSDGQRRVMLYGGRLSYAWMHPSFGAFGRPGERGFSAGSSPISWTSAATWWPPLESTRVPGNCVIVIRLWVMLLGCAIPTLLLWRLDRRLKPGHCPCGYDLTGNVSGTCPECGAEVRL